MNAFLLRVGRLSLFLALTLPLIAVQALLVRFGLKAANRLPLYYHRLCCRILGFRVIVLGQPSVQAGTLFVVNHGSYLDITLIGGVIEGGFVAKSEVADWPFFGLLAKLQRTVFVDRRIHSAHAQRDAMSERLAQGENLILFPEGTSSDGNRLLPFKSALFSAAALDNGLVPVQPVSVAYVALDGIPMGRLFRAMVAWYGDMELLPHLWEFLGLGIVTVVIEFHSVATLAEMGSRKILSEHCHRVIAQGLSLALSGRRLPSMEERKDEKRKKKKRKRKVKAPVAPEETPEAGAPVPAAAPSADRAGLPLSPTVEP